MEDCSNDLSAETKELIESGLDKDTVNLLSYYLSQKELPFSFWDSHSEDLASLPLSRKAFSVMKVQERLLGNNDVPDSSTTLRTKVLIINERNYSGEVRKGSEHDQDNLQGLFQGLGYDVKVEVDRSDWQILQDIKSHAGTRPRKAFICCIMSHGNENGIAPVEGNQVSIKEIVNCLNDEVWKNIPKIFIIEACQGGMTQYTVESIEKKIQERKDKFKDDAGLIVEIENETKCKYFLPLDVLPKNVFCFFSTVMPFASYTGEAYGSPFIFHLIENIRKFHKTTSLENIAVAVNNQVSKEEMNIEGVNFKQTSCFLSSLRQQFTF